MKTNMEIELDITLSDESKRTLQSIEEMNEKMLALTACLNKMEQMKDERFFKEYFSRKI